MKYLPLLRQSLKSDEIMDLLETHDIEVIYDFDKTHENMPDQYWASSHELGLQLSFNENQILKTIFIYITPEDDFEPADLDASDVRLFSSKDEVRAYAQDHGIETSEGQTEFLGTEHDWFRFDYPDHQIHYDFGGGSLNMISLTIT